MPNLAISESAAEFPRLLLTARRGNRAAQNKLFERYLAQVERIAHAQLRRLQGGRGTDLAARFSTADIVQDVFCTLLRRLDAFGGSSEGEFIQYVKSVVRSRAVDAIRFHQASPRDLRRHTGALGSRASELLATLSIRQPEGHDPVCASELEDQYRAALTGLSTHEREVLHARIELGLCFTELAQRLGFSSRYAARRAFFAAQSRLGLRVKASLAAAPRTH